MPALAHGNVMLAVDNLGPATWPTGVPPVLTGFTAYRLRLVSDSGPIAGIDLNGAPERGLWGYMHQRWTDDGETVTQSVFSTVENNVNSYSNDSHFLFDVNMVGTAGLQDEENPGGNSPRPNTATVRWGVGRYLRGAFAILAANQKSNLPFAYLVVPDGYESTINGMMEVAVGSNKFVVESWGASGPPRDPWPAEPSTLSLLALAGVALMRQR
jgi:hypothetical protein